MAGFVARDGLVGSGRLPGVAVGGVKARVLGRAVVGIDDVAGRAAAGAIVAGMIVGPGQRQQRIHEARLLKSQEHGIGAVDGAEAAVAELGVGTSWSFVGQRITD